MAGVVSETQLTRSKLEEITIRSLGVIESARIELQSGLNVITGETGAGKTMVLTALALILGGKADSDLVRKDRERLVVSGRFKLPRIIERELESFIEEQGLVVEDGEIVLSRTVSSDGKSRAHISGAAAAAGVLSKLAEFLIDIHGQHGTLQLSKPSRQRELLDRFGGDEVKVHLDSYRSLLEEYQSTRRRIDEFRRALSDREREGSYLADLLAEVKKLQPRENELREIDEEIDRLENLEGIRMAVTSALGALEDEEFGSAATLSQARRALSQLKNRDEALERSHQSIEEAYFSTAELIANLHGYLEGLSADPARLEALHSRKAALRAFLRRFGGNEDQEVAMKNALLLAKEATLRIEDLSGGEERLLELENQSNKQRKAVEDAARKLSQARTSTAARLDVEVVRELHDLAMPRAKFACLVNSSTLESADAEASFGSAGIDEIEMRFSTHEGGDLLPIGKAASGGELSRLMLALEVVVAATSPKGTYLFDEIDSGIGGKAALEVGRRLKRLAEHAQIIVVTHLPQVAIWADHHIQVRKDEAGAISESSIQTITGVERENEIARMLSGLEESEHAQEHARELLNLVKG